MPAFFFYLLYRYRKRLPEPGVRLKLGLLYASFNDNVWFFELVGKKASGTVECTLLVMC